MGPGALKLENNKGEKLCHAVYCKRNKNLTERFNGLFCPRHLNSLSELRTNLEQFKRNGNVYEEMIMRRKEMEFRKVQDENHIYYLKVLELRYANVLGFYAGDEMSYKNMTSMRKTH